MDKSSPPATEARVADGVGAALRKRRLTLGQTTADAARHLRIRQPYLEAIEAGRYRDLPGAAYAAGFVRAYAEHLGLDGAEAARRFKAEGGAAGPASSLRFPSPMSEGGTPRGAALLIGAAVILFAYGLWYLTSSRYLNVAEVVLPIPEHLRQMIPVASGEGAAAPPHAEPAAAAAPERAHHAPPPDAPAPSDHAHAAPAAAAAPPAASAPVPASTRVALRATADSWVEVRDRATRTTLFSRTLKAGEVFAVPDRPGLTLTTGNAGGVEIVVDGAPLPPLGKPGSVRRNLPLEPDAAREATAPPR